MQKFLDYASKKYYEGSPIMSDSEFDTLAEHFDYKKVGHNITDGIPHLYPLYSLKNIWDIQDSPLELKDCVETPKFDGAAISILYINGDLVLALTRGDGKIGRDITEKVKALVPNRLLIPGHNKEVFQVNGEVVASKHIPNSRNYAAGALNLKDIEEFKTRELTFVAYDLKPCPESIPTWLHVLGALVMNDFNTVEDLDPTDFPTDGRVFRINDNKKFQELGLTSHHPRGAFALKEKKEGEVTTLLDVIWQVGKSGVVSPVAILDPVNIGGATVARATLHNIEYIEGLGLEIGCKVEVIRAGEIIPRIVRRVD